MVAQPIVVFYKISKVKLNNNNIGHDRHDTPIQIFVDRLIVDGRVRPSDAVLVDNA